MKTKMVAGIMLLILFLLGVLSIAPLTAALRSGTLTYFHKLDISRVVNVDHFATNPFGTEWGMNYMWLLPEEHIYVTRDGYGVPFQVIDPEANERKSFVATNGGTVIDPAFNYPYGFVFMIPSDFQRGILKIHLLGLAAGWGFDEVTGTLGGKLTFVYMDETKLSFDLRRGYEYDDWVEDTAPHFAILTTYADHGLAPNGKYSHIDILTIDLSSAAEKSLTKIILDDTGTIASIPIFAVTLELITIVDVTKIANFVKSLQQPNGSFRISYTSPETLDATFWALHTLFTLDLLSVINVETTKSFILSCKNPDGGYGRQPGQASDVTLTAMALISLKILGVTPPDLSTSITFLVMSQQPDGGWDSPHAERLSHGTFYALWALKEYGSLDKADVQGAISFIKSLQADDGGFYENYFYEHNRIHATFAALVSLEVFLNSVSSVNTGKALQWLGSQQRADGGFLGAGGTTFVYETGEAMMVAKTLNQPDAINYEAAYNYVVARYIEEDSLAYWKFWGDPNLDYTGMGVFVYLGADAHAIFTIAPPVELYPLPAYAIDFLQNIDRETILYSIYFDGQSQIAYVSPGSTVDVTVTFQLWSSGGPGIIRQAFLIASWTPSWPPPPGYYFTLYNGQPSYYPGVTDTKSFSFTAPETPGTYYLWFCGQANYSVEQAVAQYTNPLTLPAHAKIIVTAPPVAPDFEISVSPSSQTVVQGSSTTATVTVSQVGGYSYSVSLYASGQPSGVTISFSPSSGTPPFTSTMNVQVASNVPTGTYPITITGTGSDGKTHTTTYTLTVTPPAVPRVEVNVGIVLVEPSGLPDHDPSHNKTYFEGIAEQLKSYYDEVSYGNIIVNYEVYDNDGNLYSLPQSLEWYGQNKDTNGDGEINKTDRDRKENHYQFIRDSIDQSDDDVNFTKYDYTETNGKGIIMFVHPSYSEEQFDGTANDLETTFNYRSQGGYFDTNDGVKIDAIIVAELEDVGTCAHEVGHALGEILVGKALPDRYREGSESGGGTIGYWGLMGTGNWLNPPVHMCSYSKNWLGWLKYKEIRWYGPQWVNSLETMNFGEDVLTFPYKKDWWEIENYYILEARTNLYGDYSERIPYDVALLLYDVDVRLVGPNIVSLVSDNYDWISDQVLVEKGQNYTDADIGIVFKFVDYLENNNKLEIWTSIEEFSGAALTGMSIVPSNNVLSAVSDVLGIPPLTPSLLPDIDLHAYTEDGKHVGVNYATGQYEVQIQGAIASRDSLGREWIFVPDNVAVHFTVNARDNQMFLDTCPAAKELTDGLEDYEVSAIYYDLNGARYESQPLTQQIKPEEVLEHPCIITQNPDGTYSVTIYEGLPLYGVQVSIEPLTASVQPGSSVQYTISIQNLGTITDTYDLTLQGLNTGWFSFSQTSITIGAGQIEQITLTVLPPAGTIAKDYPFTVTATSQVAPEVSDSADATLSVIELQSPVAAFTEDLHTIVVGETISFDASASYDPDGTIVSYEWDFGDGTTATGVTATHAYTAEGTYTVTLTITDNDGLTDTATATKTVLAPTPPPEIPEFSFATALITSIGTVLYLLFRRRLTKTKH